MTPEAVWKIIKLAERTEGGSIQMADLVNAVCNESKREIATAVKERTEECCRKVCVYCDGSWCELYEVTPTLETSFGASSWRHKRINPKDRDLTWVSCYADPLRRLSQGEAGKQ